jgi:hypothetical protein
MELSSCTRFGQGWASYLITIPNCKGLIISEAGTDNIGLRGPTIIDNINDREPTLWLLPTFGDGTANGREVSDRQFKRPLIKNRLGLPLYCPLHVIWHIMP